LFINSYYRILPGFGYVFKRFLYLLYLREFKRGVEPLFDKNNLPFPEQGRGKGIGRNPYRDIAQIISGTIP
jgi:hypothetical protein